MRRILALVLALAGASPALAAGSTYTSVNDRKLCTYKETKASANNPESCEFLCQGPTAGVRTKLLSCHDYEHLFIDIDGKSYSTWTAMLEVGTFSGIANKNGLVEWVFSSGPQHSRDNLAGLIVRFQGSDSDNHSRNALAVFSLKPREICWKGNYSTNDAARIALEREPCKSALAPEKP